MMSQYAASSQQISHPPARLSWVTLVSSHVKGWRLITLTGYMHPPRMTRTIEQPFKVHNHSNARAWVEHIIILPAGVHKTEKRRKVENVRRFGKRHASSGTSFSSWTMGCSSSTLHLAPSIQCSCRHSGVTVCTACNNARGDR